MRLPCGSAGGFLLAVHFRKQNTRVLCFGVLIALIRDAVTRNADWKVPALSRYLYRVNTVVCLLLGITVDQLFGISFGTI